MERLQTLVAATNNTHKLTELIRLFPARRVVSPGELGVRFDFDEDGDTYLANAYGKAMALYEQVRSPVLADDSGLEVAALGGQPGIYSSRYGSTAAGKLSDPERNARLLESVRDARDRRCFFVCCMVLVVEPKRFLVAQETLHGVLAHAPAGSGGFGFDPVVFIPEAGKTVAQLSDAEKDRISHRGRAAARIAGALLALRD